MRHKIEQTISYNHPVDFLFKFHCLYKTGRVLSGEQFSFAFQILIGEANQAKVDDYTYEKEGDIIQNGVHHSQCIEQVTLESHYCFPLEFLLVSIDMTVINAISIERVVQVDIGKKIVHFKLENLEGAKTQRK